MSLDTGTPLIASARAEGEAVIARLAGNLTIVNAPELRVGLTRLIEEHAPTRLVLNFTDITYLDSATLGVLIEARKAVAGNNGQVALTNLSPQIRGLIGIMKLDTVFVIADTEADALA